MQCELEGTAQLLVQPVAYILSQVLSAEDHALASTMNHHYTTNNYEEDDHFYVPPGEEGFDISHGGGEYNDLNELRSGFQKLTTYV